MDYSSDKLLSKKNLIPFLVLLILIIAIPLALRLVQTQQILKSKAAGEAITFTSSSTAPNTVNCTQTVCTTTSPTFDIQVVSPLGAAAPVTP